MTLFLLLLAFASTLSAFIFYSLLFLLKSFDMRNSIWTNIFVWFSISLLVIKDIVADRDETAHSLLLKMKKHCSGLPVDIIFLLHFFILSCVKPQIYYFQKRTIAIFWENDWNDVSNGSSWTVFWWYWWNFLWILQLFALFINTIPRKR